MLHPGTTSSTSQDVDGILYTVVQQEQITDGAAAKGSRIRGGLCAVSIQKYRPSLLSLNMIDLQEEEITMRQFLSEKVCCEDSNLRSKNPRRNPRKTGRSAAFLPFHTLFDTLLHRRRRDHVKPTEKGERQSLRLIREQVG